MIIKLTNVSKDFKGQLLINGRHIMSVFSQAKAVDDKTVENVTVIYSVTKESWEVKESVEEVYDLLNGRDSIYTSFDLNEVEPPIYMGTDMTDDIEEPIIKGDDL